MATPSLTKDPALGLGQREKMEILFAVLLAIFLSALDQNVVGTALPRIVSDLGGNDLYTWVVTIYLLTSTVTGPLYGKLSDQYGRKPMLLVGMGLFLLGSALCGLSQNMAMLLAFRGLQGIGAGALFPIVLAVIGDLFTPQERGRYQGLFGAVFGLSFLVGPFIGGFLTDRISWHWVFYVNLPIGLISMLVVARLLPTIKHPAKSLNFDWLGSAVFIVGVSLILVGLTNKQSADWSSPAVAGLLAAGGALTALFIFIESRVTEPIIPLQLWRLRTYAASMTAVFFSSIGFFGLVIFLPRWFQFVRGASATESGYQTLALLVGVIGSSVLSGILVSRIGRYRVLLTLSTVVMLAGLGLMTQLTATTELPVLWLWMFICGLGIGPSLGVYTIVVQNAVPYAQMGAATSNLTFFRQIGGSVGLAIIGTVFGTKLQERIPPRLLENGVPQQLIDQLKASGASSDAIGVGRDLGATILGQLPPQAQAVVGPLIPKIVQALHEAFSDAVATTFVAGIVSTLLALVAVFLIKDLPLRGRGSHAGPPPAAG